MSTTEVRPQVDLRRLLELVEAAAPIDAVDVVAAELGRMLQARRVGFLISDSSGHSVVRLSTTGPAAGEATRACPECISEIPVRARRCAFCTAEVGPGA